MQITRLGVELARDLAADELFLRDGAEVVVRVLQAPAGGGRGVISLAGRRIPAQLPPGLAEGQRLQVAVEARGADRLLLRIVSGPQSEPAGDQLSRLAAALSLSGDPELLRVALALTGGAVPLPGGSAGAVQVEPDAEGSSEGAAAPTHARVTLHSPELGPIEIALTLATASISAAVTVEPGRPAELAGREREALAEALERAAGRPSGVTIAARSPAERRPVPPIPVDWVDVQA